MGVTVKVSTAGIDKLAGSLDDIQLAFTNEVKETAEQYVPMEYGDLRGHVTVNQDEITYEEEYAVYVYNMDEGTNFTTPGTSGFWDEKVKEHHVDELEDFVAQRIQEALR